jgi:hypothetical protein
VGRRGHEASGRPLALDDQRAHGCLDAACEELEFGADIGAAGVFMLGEINGRHVAHPTLFQLYGKAEQLGFVIGFHVGMSSSDVLHRYPET